MMGFETLFYLLATIDYHHALAERVFLACFGPRTLFTIV